MTHPSDYLRVAADPQMTIANALWYLARIVDALEEIAYPEKKGEVTRP